MVKKMAVICASGLLVLTGAACGGPKTDKVEAVTPQVDNKPVELNVFESSRGYKLETFMDLYGNKIQKKYPHFTFKMYSPTAEVTLKDIIATGVKLDIVKITSMTAYDVMFENNLQSDLSDLIKKYNYDLSAFEPSVLDHMRLLGDGKLYGLPNAVASTALFYNKSLFNKFGVPYPTNGMTWDEVYDLAKRMTRTDNGVQYQGLFADFNYMAMMNSFSQPFLDTKTNKATFVNDNWKTIIGNFARFHQLGGNPPIVNGRDAFYVKETLAMYATLSGGSYDLNVTTDWDVVQLPTYKERPGIGSGALIPSYTVASTSQHRDQAFLAIAEIASESFQKEFTLKGFASPLKNKELRDSLGKGEPKLSGKQIKNIVPDQFAASYPINKFQNVIAPFLNTAFNEVVESKKDVNTALRDAEEAANKKIQETLAVGK
jgi:multiple sugar transport system substrate-binding protein